MLAVLPSPKLQLQVDGLLADVSMKLTLNGELPTVGLPKNPAIGLLLLQTPPPSIQDNDEYAVKDQHHIIPVSTAARSATCNFQVPLTAAPLFPIKAASDESGI